MRILVTGGDGQLGREFSQLPPSAGTTFIRCDRVELDICNNRSVEAAINRHKPDAIINTAAYTAVDRAETERDAAFAINADGAGLLARASARHNLLLLHVSTDYVFDGMKPTGETYREDDVCNPQSIYGASKLAGEQQALAACPATVILRTSWVFGRYGNNFPKTMLRLAAEREELRVVADQYGCPTHAADIAATLVQAASALLAGRMAPGIYHYAGAPACNWFELAQAVIARAGKQSLLSRQPKLLPITTQDYPVAALRPPNSALCTDKIRAALGIPPSDWSAGINVLLHELSATDH